MADPTAGAHRGGRALAAATELRSGRQLDPSGAGCASARSPVWIEIVQGWARRRVDGRVVGTRVFFFRVKSQESSVDVREGLRACGCALMSGFPLHGAWAVEKPAAVKGWFHGVSDLLRTTGGMISQGLCREVVGTLEKQMRNLSDEAGLPTCS